MVKIELDDGFHGMQGIEHASGVAAAAEHQSSPRKLGWAQQDTLSSYAQENQTSPSWTQSMGDWFGSWFRTKPIEGVEVSSTDVAAIDSSKSVAPLSEVQKQNLERVQSRFDALMERFNKDCPGMDIDQVIELLFYIDQDSKKEEMETQKIALQDKYKALKQHREEYRKLADDLAKELKAAGFWQMAQEFSTVGTAAIAAVGAGPAVAIPVIILAAGKLISSYNGNAVEHATARMLAKTGIISEQTGYNVIQGGVNALFLLGSVLGGGAEPTKVVKALQQIAAASKMVTTVGNEYTGYKSENRRADVQFASANIEQGQKGVDRAMQDVASCSKRGSEVSRSIGAWATQLDGQIKALMS